MISIENFKIYWRFEGIICKIISKLTGDLSKNYRYQKNYLSPTHTVAVVYFGPIDKTGLTEFSGIRDSEFEQVIKILHILYRRVDGVIFPTHQPWYNKPP